MMTFEECLASHPEYAPPGLPYELCMDEAEWGYVQMPETPSPSASSFVDNLSIVSESGSYVLAGVATMLPAIVLAFLGVLGVVYGYRWLLKAL